jgi:hypothetical protein
MPASRNTPPAAQHEERRWGVKNFLQNITQEKNGFLERWYRFTASPPPPSNSPLAQRESARRARLTSMILLITSVAVLVLVMPIAIFQHPALSFVLSGLLAIIALALFINRQGHSLLAGSLAIIGLDLSFVFALLIAPNGLDAHALSLYDLMILPELFTALLLPPISVFAVALANSIFIVLDLSLQQRSDDLARLIQVSGLEVYARPVILHFIVALVMFLWVCSTMRAIERADQARVIAELQQKLAEQTRVAVEQNARLEDAIEEIMDVHLRFVNGDLNVRLSPDSENVLWLLAGPLNNLLGWLQQARQLEVQAQKMQKALQRANQIEYALISTQRDIQTLTSWLQTIKQYRRPLRSQQLGITAPALGPLLAELDGVTLLDTEAPQERDSGYFSTGEGVSSILEDWVNKMRLPPENNPM